MRPYGLALGLLSGLLEAQLLSGHPLLGVYRDLVESHGGPGSFAALVLAAHLALSLRGPGLPATVALATYVSEAALASPLVRSLLPIPNPGQPSPWLGAAAVALAVASMSGGPRGALVAALTAPGLLALPLLQAVPRLPEAAAAALAAVGSGLLAWGLRRALGGRRAAERAAT